VDAFDLDPRMVTQARERLSGYGARARVWVGDAAAIAVADSTYDAVFDFGIIHHVPSWRRALAEVRRVLKPQGVFYCEEVFGALIDHPVVRRLLRHPLEDRFDRGAFLAALSEAGLRPLASAQLWSAFGWFIARPAEGSSSTGPGGRLHDPPS
jgi:SAM-dependent methyltransferase